MKAKYLGYWSSCCGCNGDGFGFKSLKQAKKTMREIAAGNNTGRGAKWCVFRAEDVERHGRQPGLAVVRGEVR